MKRLFLAITNLYGIGPLAILSIKQLMLNERSFEFSLAFVMICSLPSIIATVLYACDYKPKG